MSAMTTARRRSAMEDARTSAIWAGEDMRWSAACPRATAHAREKSFCASGRAGEVALYIMCSSWVPIICVGKRSAEYNSTGDFVSLRHQCDVVLNSVETSPRPWTIGTEQLLAY